MIYKHNWGVKKSGGKWRSAKGYENHPVVYVTWYGANEFCRFYGYCLPTEAEWEYAARGGGKKVRFGNGKNIADPKEINFDGRSEYKKSYSVAGVCRKKTTDVGFFTPNQLGLYDMSGNVWEWCSDWYGSGYYKKSPDQNPQGPSSGNYRVLRGGSWVDKPRLVRCSVRGGNSPVFGGSFVGFRCAKSLAYLSPGV